MTKGVAPAWSLRGRPDGRPWQSLGSLLEIATEGRKPSLAMTDEGIDSDNEYRSQLKMLSH